MYDEHGATDAHVDGNKVTDFNTAGEMGSPLKGKQRDGIPTSNKGPLRLLDLPLDILKEIVQKVSHTNDLAALALTHSALHDLAIPHIYSRFDIVWPDSGLLVEPRAGVDALTYGLATLVMGEDIFEDRPSGLPEGFNNGHCKHCAHCNGETPGMPRPRKRRRGNYYAQYTKKFSLGNGPLKCVSEYAVTKESGKMLGTLVALALARMHSLETFIWDMPTGILRDVWTALSSLGDRQDCRLQRVWIRWQDSRNIDLPAPGPAVHPPPLPPIPPPPAVGSFPPPPPPPIHLVAPNGTAPPHPPSYQHTTLSGRDMDLQSQTFSMLPPLKSLSVLDIDQLPYLDEMSILISKSRRSLKELRVGISHGARSLPWVAAWEGDGAQQVDPSAGATAARAIGEKRLGGVLGVLVGRIYDMRQPAHQPTSVAGVNQGQEQQDRPGPSAQVDELPHPDQQAVETGLVEVAGSVEQVESEDQETAKLRYGTRLELVSPVKLPGDAPLASGSVDSQLTSGDAIIDRGPNSSPSSSSSFKTSYEHQDSPPSPLKLTRSPFVIPTVQKKRLANLYPESSAEVTLESSQAEASEAEETHAGVLSLETLELERFPLSVSVLQNAINWTMLTSLTILDCANGEQLWKTLRKVYLPLSPEDFTSRGMAASGNPRSTRPRSYRERAGLPAFEYRLNLRKIHTNIVSASLISFLKETLAPNSLEVLFLQDSRTNPSLVSIDAIYRGPIRRHRGSLKKLLIDSSEKNPYGVPTGSSRWGKWMLDKEVLGYITSGRMPSLRELSIALDYHNWHFFLQRLPSIPRLRSLHIPFMAHHVHGTNIDPRELALHMIDIVALRPEMELCYMGISKKCFEILEIPRHNPDLLHDNSGGAAGEDTHTDDPIEEEDDEDDEDDEEADDDEEGGAVGTAATEVTDSESDRGLDDSEDDGYSLDGDDAMPKLKLREILFFDDKVAIFKARHGRI